MFLVKKNLHGFMAEVLEKISGAGAIHIPIKDGSEILIGSIAIYDGCDSDFVAMFLRQSEGSSIFTQKVLRGELGFINKDYSDCASSEVVDVFAVGIGGAMFLPVVGMVFCSQYFMDGIAALDGQAKHLKAERENVRTSYLSSDLKYSLVQGDFKRFHQFVQKALGQLAEADLDAISVSSEFGMDKLPE